MRGVGRNDVLGTRRAQSMRYTMIEDSDNRAGDIADDEVVVIDLDDPLTQRVLDVCDRTGDFISWWGFRTIHGRVWTLLALLDRPLSQSDVAELLGVSRALISGAVQELEDWGLVLRTREDRRAPIVANLDVWPVITHVLRTREWMLLEGVRVAIDAAIQEADLRASRGLPPSFSRENLAHLAKLTDLAQSILKVILEMRSVPHGRRTRYFMQAASYAIDGLRRVKRASS